MTDIPLLKRQIDAQMTEYEQAIADYAAFMEAWRARNPQHLPLFTEEAGLARPAAEAAE